MFLAFNPYAKGNKSEKMQQTFADYGDSIYRKGHEELFKSSISSSGVVDVARDTIDMPECQHENSGSITMGKDARTLEMTAMTNKHSLLNNFRTNALAANSIQKIKLSDERSNNAALSHEEKKSLSKNESEKKRLNKIIDATNKNTQKDDADQSVKSIKSQMDATNKLLKGMMKVQTLNTKATYMYMNAVTKSVKEAKHDENIFNECAASLMVDSLNTMEHVRYFYPRQVSDGSYKTFEGPAENRDDIEEKVKELAAIGDPDAVMGDSELAFVAYEKIMKDISKITTSSLEEHKGAPRIEERIRSFWGCSMASAATYSLIRWARRSQKLGLTSVEQYDEKEKIIEKGKESLELACKNVLEEKLAPAPTALTVCNAWMNDTMKLSQKCSEKGDVKDSGGSDALGSSWADLSSINEVHINNTAALEASAEKTKKV